MIISHNPEAPECMYNILLVNNGWTRKIMQVLFSDGEGVPEIAEIAEPEIPE